MYLKTPNSLSVINNDANELKMVMFEKARSKEMRQLKKEMSLLRKEVDQLKLIVLGLQNG